MPDALAPVRAALARPGSPSSDHTLGAQNQTAAFALPPGVKPRAAAVLIALSAGPEGPWLHLTKRSAGLRHHPGQIALPGGKTEPADATPVVTALREAHEEIGLDPAQTEVLGSLAPHLTVTGFYVTPVVAAVTGPFCPTPEPGEVEEAFKVPLAFLANPKNYRIERRLWRGTWRQYYVAPWGPYYIWGATAAILHGLAQRICA